MVPRARLAPAAHGGSMKTHERIAAEHAGHEIGRSNDHDRTACITCDAWVEPQCRCAGTHCEHYPDAPERPSQATIEHLYRAASKGAA